jgi:PIN domain
MRMVLDTDVLVAAFRSEHGASRQLLIAALDERFVLLASTAMWLEYEAVMTRPHNWPPCSLMPLKSGMHSQHWQQWRSRFLSIFYGDLSCSGFSDERQSPICWLRLIKVISRKLQGRFK